MRGAWRALLAATFMIGCYEYRHVAPDVPNVPDVADVADVTDAPGVMDVRDGPDAGVACGGACSPGRTCCAEACVDLATNTANCGRCGAACPAVEHAALLCTAGGCRFRCATGYADCDGLATNGCEVDLRTSAPNCGGCGTACAAHPHGGAACVAGECALACEAGYAACNADLNDGCEVDTRADLVNCGACGRACPTAANADRVCATGVCSFTCRSHFADCDGAPGNGCEADLFLLAAHCGACGHACSGRTRCVGGACVDVVEVSGGRFTMGEPELDAGVGVDAAVDAAIDAAVDVAVDVHVADGADAPSAPLVVDPRDGAPQQPNITVSAFVLDRNEVTVERFRRYWLDGHPGAGARVTYPGPGTTVPWQRTNTQACSVVEPTPSDVVGTPEKGFRAAECNWSLAPGTRETHPINCIDWCTAQAYCVWAGGRLPTEAEWEFAARGIERRPYPWGADLPSDQLCWLNNLGTHPGGTCPVGSFPAGATPSGIFDLLGNVSEWTADTYSTYLDLRPGGVTRQCWGAVPDRFNPVCLLPSPAAGGIAPAYSEDQRAVRGSAWHHEDTQAIVHVAARVERLVEVRRSFIGFRCAWSP